MLVIIKEPPLIVELVIHRQLEHGAAYVHRNRRVLHSDDVRVKLVLVILQRLFSEAKFRDERTVERDDSVKVLLEVQPSTYGILASAESQEAYSL